MRKGMLAPSLVGVIALIVFAGLSTIIFATMGALQAKFTKEAIVGLEYHPTVAEDALMSLMEVQSRQIPKGAKIDVYFVFDKSESMKDEMGVLCDNIYKGEYSEAVDSGKSVEDIFIDKGIVAAFQSKGIDLRYEIMGISTKIGTDSSDDTISLPCSTMGRGFWYAYSDREITVAEFTGVGMRPESWGPAVWALSSKEEGSIEICGYGSHYGNDYPARWCSGVKNLQIFKDEEMLRTEKNIEDCNKVDVSRCYQWFRHNYYFINTKIWRDDAIRVIITISDDGPHDKNYNDKVDSDDESWTAKAIDAARENGVIVFPMIGSLEIYEKFAQRMGKKTGGKAFLYSKKGNFEDRVITWMEESLGSMIKDQKTFRDAAVQASYEWSTATEIGTEQGVLAFDLSRRAKEYLDYSLAGKEYLLFFYDENRVGEEYNRMLPLATNIINYDLITDVSADRWKKLIKQFEDSPYPVSASVPLIDGRWLVLYVKEGSE